jgi:hypothetical protein
MQCPSNRVENAARNDGLLPDCLSPNRLIRTASSLLNEIYSNPSVRNIKTKFHNSSGSGLKLNLSIPRSLG